VGGGIALVSLDQRFEFLLVSVVLLWWVFGHAHKVFDELCVRL
jgi:hypothetical protein